MRKLTVELGEHSYDIRIGDGVLASIGEEARRFISGGEQVAVVTDETVWEFYRDPFTASLEAAGLSAQVSILPPGEESKSLEALSRLYGDFAKIGLSRSGLVIAFGGGVVGDVAGLAAATYMRGVRYLQVPTTLLAQVDSSVGGKTAVNLADGKNLVGAFHQPQAVLIDTRTLRTLDPREYRSGMAEVVKYGAIASRSLFHRLNETPDENALPDLIADCCSIKAEIVARDELEQGERMLLNFGHTVGHAVEKHSGYRIRHGEAVAIGMALAAQAGEALGVTASGTAGHVCRLLDKLGLDFALPCPAQELFPLMRNDKKSSGDGVQLVLLRDIAIPLIRHTPYAELERLLLDAEKKTFDISTK